MRRRKSLGKKGRDKKMVDIWFPFIKTVADFAELIVSRYGEIISSTGDGHSHMVSELLNFKDFSFHIDMGQKKVGGNSIKVWYHPGGLYKKDLVPVFDIWWRTDITKCKLRTFSQDGQWHSQILGIIKYLKMDEQRIDRDRLEYIVGRPVFAPFSEL